MKFILEASYNIDSRGLKVFVRCKFPEVIRIYLTQDYFHRHRIVAMPTNQITRLSTLQPNAEPDQHQRLANGYSQHRAKGGC